MRVCSPAGREVGGKAEVECTKVPLAANRKLLGNVQQNAQLQKFPWEHFRSAHYTRKKVGFPTVILFKAEC